MTINKYQKFGLRSDKNLSDIKNPDAALQSLLNDISPTRFIPADIKVINGLRSTQVTQEDILQLNGLVSVYNPAGGSAQEQINPLITIKDFIDNAKIITGNPPFEIGGDGPLAYFVPSSAMNDQNTFSSNTSGDDLFQNSDIVGPVYFWESGNFVLNAKIYETFQDSYGLIQWTGYISDISKINIISSGLFMVEQDPFDDGNWETLKSIYDEERSVDIISSSTVASSTTLELGKGVKHVAVNDTVEIGGNNYVITSVNNSEQTATIDSAVSTTPDTTYDFTTSLSDISLESGTLDIRSTYTGDKIKVRFTVWWPDPQDPAITYQNKSIEFRTIGISGGISGNRLVYNYIYSEYDRDATPDQYSYEYFEKNRASSLSQESNSAIETSQSLKIDYEPPQQFIEKIFSTTPSTVVYEGLGKLSSEDEAFSDIEVGDWILSEVSADLYYTYQIKEKESSSVVFIDKNADFVSISANTDILAVKNLGIVGVYRHDNGTLYQVQGGSPVSEVYKDYLIAGIKPDGSDPNTNFLRIESVSPSITTSSITTSDVFGSGTETLPANTAFAVVYSHKGLDDLSSVALCAGVFAKEVTATTASGNNIIQVSDTDNITKVPSVYVQFGNTDTGTGYTSSFIPDGVTVVGIGTADGLANNEIQLSANVTDTINSGSTITFIVDLEWSANTGKEFCVLPLNTAPPFESTDLGLSTTSGYPNLKTNGLEFTNLEIDTPNTNISTTSNTDYSETYSIYFGATEYKSFIK